MSDSADEAQALEEALRHAALAKRWDVSRVPQASAGRCFNCDAPLPSGRRWCNAICRDEWETERA